MTATITKRETIIVEADFEVPASNKNAEAEPMVLPWYRRVPAPGLTTSRHRGA